MVIGYRALTENELIALAGCSPLATAADVPEPFVQTEAHKRELGARLARYSRRRQAAELGQDWTTVS